jgi:integrase
LERQDEPIVFQDLRHTFGTLAVQVWPVTDLQAFMGHSRIETTMRYVPTCRSTTPLSGSPVS